ncbi:MAG TPA: aminotransferase class V-fold PLP-dependent enzyme [Calditrichia bacterium]|nr:aminotransferase class V-fold PLP-dependent enzyme [Calditrichota bacterium]HQU71576.1 aminotransferase class V-fold PLP-dependent enzyme [Calditrichia bacterium]HQV30519.1 aminotransferase class V-fold PLP-dependent enzyme [Calditrichia bacterium]
MIRQYYSVNEKYRKDTGQLNITPRFLFGSGPANAYPRVLQAIGSRQIANRDPQFVDLIKDIQSLLRYAWQTDNAFTLPISGTGRNAMEAVAANLIEPNDRILVGVNGFFGNYICEAARRYGAKVFKLKGEIGAAFSLSAIEAQLKRVRPKVFFLIHGQSASGTCQPMEGIGELCHRYDTLLVLDTVTSLGAVPVFLDHWKVDAAFTTGHRCLSCPPGISAFTFSERALRVIRNRKSRIANSTTDFSGLIRRKVSSRHYLYTLPINLVYGLREALQILAEQGLEVTWKRHRETAEALWEGLAEMGLRCPVHPDIRLPNLTAVDIPDTVDADRIRPYLLKEFNIEISSGLGDWQGRVWRLGLMGINSRRANVVLLLSALKNALAVHRRAFFSETAG